MFKNGFQPDIISYNITLKGLCSCGRISDGIALFDDALKHGILPTSITWYILVRAVLKLGPLDSLS
jgi:pentatricopeptide repeat protein